MGIRLPKTRDLGALLERIRLWDGSPLPAGLRARLQREWEHAQFLHAKIVELERGICAQAGTGGLPYGSRSTRCSAGDRPGDADPQTEPLTDLVRQSVYRRLAGYEDVNDAERLSHDPTFRLIGSEKIWERRAAPRRPGCTRLRRSCWPKPRISRRWP